MKKSYLGLGLAGAMVMAVLAGLVCVGSLVGLFVVFMNVFKSHEVYQLGMAVVQNDPAVKELFGAPVSDGFFVSGNITETAYGSGKANLSTSLAGPEANGQVQINGYKTEGGAWQIQDMRIRVNNKQVLIYYGTEPDKGFQPAP